MAAIYQWYINGVVYTLRTTPPYPIEEKEGIKLGMALTSGHMWPVPKDELEAVFSFLSGTLEEILFDLPLEEDELEAAFSFLSGTLEQILNDLPLKEEELDAVFSFLSGTLETLLVNAYMPDHGLIIGCGPKPSLCSMTPV
jgi:hypothetical protein